MIGIGVPVGVVMGVAGRKLKPDWCKSYNKSYHRKWWLFLMGFVFFGFLSYSEYLKGNLPRAIYLAALLAT
jgi:hypothetical protein